MLVADSLRFARDLARVAGALCIAVLAMSTAPAEAKPPRYPDILPLSQVKPGMVGYGLTTFQGVTVSRFEVRVVGILKKENAGHDLILIRMNGGPITERGANLIQGMSGSPIYLNGKIVGAFSMGEQFPKEPVGMVTPIEDMLEAWDPDIPQQPTYFQPAVKPEAEGKRSGPVSGAWRPESRSRVVDLPEPIDVGGRRLRRLVLNVPPSDLRGSTEDMAVLRPATTLLAVTSISARDRAWFQQELDRRGYAITVTDGPGVGAGSFKGAPLRPGSAFGTFLATGDIEVGATGTVTYRRGDKILGFGHPLMGLGAVESAITSASIVDIFSGLRISHHIAVAGPVVGTLVQDRDFSVSAELGRTPHLVPVDVTVHDATTGRSRVFTDYVLQHPDLTPLLLRLIAHESIAQVHDVPGDVMARVTTTVDAAEVGKITRTNVVFDPDDIGAPAIQDLTEISAITSGNPFYPLPINRVRLTVDISSGHNAATLDRIFLKQGRFEPGDTVEIGVVMNPYRRSPIMRTLTLKIPQETPSGRYQLLVRGGAPLMLRSGSISVGMNPYDGQTAPTNVKQMVSRLMEREANTDVVARLMLNSTTPTFEGEKLSDLPPNISAVMRSDRNSGVRLERDDVRARLGTDYVVSGVQQLFVTVVRKNMQESGAQSGVGGQQAPSMSAGTLGSIPASGAIGVSLGGDGSDPGDASSTAETLSARSEIASADAPDTGSGAVGSSDGAQPSPPPQVNPKSGKEKRSRAKRGAQPAVAAATPASSPPAAAQADTGNDRPVGRQPQTWRQTAGRDFSTGKLSGTSVSVSGELLLAPTLQRLATTSETYIWAIEPDGQGGLFAGTGTSGKVLRIGPSGSATIFASLPVVSVQCLLRTRDGGLWAGSAVKGDLWRISPSGEPTLVCTLPEKYILSMAEDSKGDLYLGPGGGGTVYRLTSAQRRSSTPVIPDAYLKTSADHIMALHVDAHDNLYVGTGNTGIIYQVSPTGKSRVLYDAKENAVTALTTDAEGNLYFGTGPKSALYRTTPEGVTSVIYDRATTFFTAIKNAPDGSLYACTVNALYHIRPGVQPDGAPAGVEPFDNPRDVDFLALAILPDGRVATSTGNVGEIYASTSVANSHKEQVGAYESVVHDARVTSRWGEARWIAEVPKGTHVRVETRTGNSSDPDATWSAWAPVRATSTATSEGSIISPAARFIQFRLSLTSETQGAPCAGLRFHEISISYMPRNQQPRISLVSPIGGENWAKSQTIRWNGSDPDNDTLNYEVYVSGDDGATWKPLPSDGEGTAARTDANGQSQASQQPMPEMAKKMPDNVRQAIMDSMRHEAPGGAAARSGSLRATSRQWDTKSVPDGVYRIKVIASDRPSNPTEYLTAEAMSDSFTIVNSLPTVEVAHSATPAADGTVTIQGMVSQSLIAVTGVQYRVDGSEWTAAVPRDGLFDSSHVSFSFKTAPLPHGSHTIEIAAFNSAGARTVEKVSVEAQ